MRKYNISTSIIRAIENLYDKARGAVLFSGSTEELFRTTVGVRQEDHMENSTLAQVKLIRTLILSTFLYACESWALPAEIERRIQALEMRCYRRLLNISYKDHVTNEELELQLEWRWSPNHGKETTTQMVWPHFKIGHVEDNSAGDSERSKKERKTENEMGR